MKGTLKLRNINRDNKYELELLQYNNQQVKVLADYGENGETYEIETQDGSEYTIFKYELTQ